MEEAEHVLHMKKPHMHSHVCFHVHTHTHIHKSSVCSPQHVTKRLLLWAAADASVWCSCDVTGHERSSVSLRAAWMSECTRSRHTSTRRAAAMAHRLSMMWVNDLICSSSLAHCFYHSAPVLNCVLCGGFFDGLASVRVCVMIGVMMVKHLWSWNEQDALLQWMTVIALCLRCCHVLYKTWGAQCVCLAGADVYYDAISQSHALEQNVLL